MIYVIVDDVFFFSSSLHGARVPQNFPGGFVPFVVIGVCVGFDP